MDVKREHKINFLDVIAAFIDDAIVCSGRIVNVLI